MDFEVVDVVPDRTIVWQVKSSSLPWLKDRTEWNDTSIVWELTPDGRGTRIRMTHRGLTPRVECFDRCKEGWDFFVGRSLLGLLVEDRGLPDREEDPPRAGPATRRRARRGSEQGEGRTDRGS